MSARLNAYELIGVTAPGAVALFGLTLLFPELNIVLTHGGFSVGDFGLFLVLSFVAGHLVQGIGNLLETLLWEPFGGKPTSWVIKNPERLIHSAQVNRLQRAVRADFGCDLQSVSRRDWVAIVREMYVVVQNAGLNERVDSFNRAYGLMRGVTAAFASLTVITLVVNWSHWEAVVLTVAVMLVAGYRMFRFGKRYGRELVVSYLQTTASGGE